MGWASYFLPNNDYFWSAAIARLNNNFLAIPEYASDNVKVFPNPTKGIVYLDNFENNYTYVNIYNQLGQLISSALLGKTSNEKIDLSNFIRGIYILQFVGQEFHNSIKVIKN